MILLGAVYLSKYTLVNRCLYFSYVFVIENDESNTCQLTRSIKKITGNRV